MKFSILQPTLKQALALAGAHIGKGGPWGLVAIEATESNGLRVSARDQDNDGWQFIKSELTTEQVQVLRLLGVSAMTYGRRLPNDTVRIS